MTDRDEKYWMIHTRVTAELANSSKFFGNLLRGIVDTADDETELQQSVDRVLKRFDEVTMGERYSVIILALAYYLAHVIAKPLLEAEAEGLFQNAVDVAFDMFDDDEATVASYKATAKAFYDNYIVADGGDDK